MTSRNAIGSSEYEWETAIICGDNFYGRGLSAILQKQANYDEGACIFEYRVNEFERYGVMELNGEGKLVNFEEKPTNQNKYCRSWFVFL